MEFLINSRRRLGTLQRDALMIPESANVPVACNASVKIPEDISAAEILYSKSGQEVSLETIHKILNRKLNVPSISVPTPRRFASIFSKPSKFGMSQRRFFFSSFNPDKIEEQANENPLDSKKQAALYRSLVETDPEAIISRFEDPRFARDSECVVHYLCALYETNQLERATKNFLVNIPNLSAKDSVSASNLHFLNFGTKERPLYVNSINSGSSGWKRFGVFLNMAIVGAILYSIYSMSEQRLGGVTSKVHKMFNKELTDKTYCFEDVQGCDEAKQELEDIVEFLKNPEKFNKLGAKMPKGVLLVGPPGTGKTLLAKAVAGEANVPFFYASGSSFDEVFVGVGSMRIRQMFENAKQHAPSIIFIDELDAIGSKRNPRDPQHSRMSLNQLLTELDGFAESTGVIVIAATNIPEALDKALLRPGRFDKHVYVPLPDMRGRKKIIDMYLKDTILSDDVDTEIVARSTPGFSGADLSKLVNQAKISASVENGNMITMSHLEESKDEMIMGAERKSTIILPQDRNVTAFHESGHAIVALKTKNSLPIHKVTIIPRGRALGMVAQLPENDELSISKAQLLARMDVAMGGRVAEELVFGSDNITTGASSDFNQANAIARAMVTQYGMSEKVGPLLVNPEDIDSLSPATKDLIDSEIKKLLDASKIRALKILTDHRHDLDKLAEALIEYETLSREEILRILSLPKHSPIDHLF